MSTPFGFDAPREAIEAAIPIYEQILTMVAAADADRCALGRGFHFLAQLYESIENHRSAEARYRDAFRTLEAPETCTDAAGAANNLGLFFLRRGEATEAETWFLRVLDLWALDDARDPSDAAVAQQNLAALYLGQGDLRQADRWISRALESLAAARSVDPGRLAIVRQNRAFVDHSLGRYQEAELGYRQVLESSGLPSSVRGATLNKLGEALRLAGRFEDAEPVFESAAEMFSPQSPGRALVLANLGALHYDRGDPESAAPFLERALAMRQVLHGETSPEAGRCLVSLAIIQLASGRTEEAVETIERGIGIWRQSRPPGHPELAGAYENAALIHLAAGRDEEARRWAAEARRSKEQQLARVLSFGSEADRLAYLDASAPYDLLANLASEPQDVEALADAVLKSKGVVLESMLDERRLARRADTPEARAALARLYSARQRWMRASLGTPVGSGEGANDGIADLERVVSEAEKALAEAVGGLAPPARSASVSLKEVRERLETDRALVELVRYERHTGRGGLADHYGALVITRSGPVSWVPLGAAEEIDDLVRQFLARMRSGARGVAPLDRDAVEAVNDESLSDLLGRLDRSIWQPMAGLVPPNVRRVSLAPDAALHLLPFGVLLDSDGRFLVERFDLDYLSSGRDLLRARLPPPNRTLAIFADPMYGHEVPGPSGFLDRLPFTRTEAAAIATLAGLHQWEATVVLGQEASEAALRGLRAPGVLHVATHGFVGTGPTLVRETPPESFDHPMLASFLALAGAEPTLSAWRRNQVPEPGNDGILTAAEVSDLDLEGTWLAVLSACDTGLGDPRAGEGVFGLRRGFALAGVHQLLTTSWSVDDSATADVMASFYEELLRGEEPARALNAVQRRYLARLRREESLVSAVWKAGGFLLSR